MIRIDTHFTAAAFMTPEIAAALANAASRFNARISLVRGGISLAADSIIGVVSMKLTRGDELTVEAEGAEEKAAAEAIVKILL